MPGRINKVWEDFERITGWRLHGSYTEMDAKTKQRLDAVYKPHITRLSRMLGQDFDALWRAT
jgi:hypothetical protein